MPKIRRMNEQDLSLVRQWRNHPDIRRHMYTRYEIGAEEHNQWFARQSIDPARHLLIFEVENEPLGFVHFHQVNAGRVADWGFYVAPESPGGTGTVLGETALAYAFNQDFHKICGQALAYNERSIRLHLRLGFRQEGVFRDQYFDGKNFHSIFYFGLLASEWQEKQ
jgi:UDP-4-amino-4,6-dideoxy-N-acetyl-beta-L-altrosamine N-acetyltransferase